MAFFTWDKRNERQLLELPLLPLPSDDSLGASHDLERMATLQSQGADSAASFLDRGMVGVQDGNVASPLPGSFSPATIALPTQTRGYRVSKRTFDLAISLLLLPLLGVLLVLIGIVVALTSGFPVFYRQHRIGQHGRTFRIFKFRTMRNNADQALAEWLMHRPDYRDEWQQTHKIKRDPRITGLGRFLRDTSLDEIPQILNVLRGEMSLVGPRPIVQAERTRYAERFVYYTAAVPGITGVWQVSGRCNVSYEDRVKMDEDYVRHWSLMRDIVILLRTPKSVIRRDGAC